MISWSKVITHVVATLPDSIDERVLVLMALLDLVPADHPQHASLMEVLLSLKRHQRAQRELPLLFATMKEEAQS